MKVEFGNELSPYGHRGNDGVSLEIRTSEVHRAIDCRTIRKEPVCIFFGSSIDQEKLDAVFHPIFNRFPLDWLFDLKVNSHLGVDLLCKSLSSYLRERINQNSM